LLKVILVRHGETEWNIIRRIQGGNSDTPLNENGQRQAAGVAVRLKTEPVKAIYSSPLQRALHTAQAIAQFHHNLEIETRPSLREIMVGELEGMWGAEMKLRFDQLLCQYGNDRSLVKLPGGESLGDVQKRAWETFQEITGKHTEGTVVLVTHYFVILSIICQVLNLPLNEITRMRSHPGTVSIIVVENGHARLELFNDGCHAVSN
jgi:broad specificity phosphatase PhoE